MVETGNVIDNLKLLCVIDSASLKYKFIEKVRQNYDLMCIRKVDEEDIIGNWLPPL